MHQRWKVAQHLSVIYYVEVMSVEQVHENSFWSEREGAIALPRGKIGINPTQKFLREQSRNTRKMYCFAISGTAVGGTFGE